MHPRALLSLAISLLVGLPLPGCRSPEAAAPGAGSGALPLASSVDASPADRAPTTPTTPTTPTPPASSAVLPAASAGTSDASAAVEISASTNSRGQRVTIDPSGKVTYAAGTPAGKAEIPRALADRLFKDLAAARPLSALSVVTCAKSASFGTSETISFAGERTPDLSCSGQQGKAGLLADDLAAIWKQLGLQGG